MKGRETKQRDKRRESKKLLVTKIKGKQWTENKTEHSPYSKKIGKPKKNRKTQESIVTKPMMNSNEAHD